MKHYIMTFRIAVFASGSGTNAENIALYFKKHPKIKVVCFLSNNPNAFVLQRAKNLKIPGFVFSKSDFSESEKIMNCLAEMKVDFIVLAGFLFLLPNDLLKAFPNKVLNIHPSLLPKYGGKGMYGMNVHKAVIENKEKESGITIHFVNEHYDEGKLIFQEKCVVKTSDTPESLAQTIHELEYKCFPEVIEQVILNPQKT